MAADGIRIGRTYQLTYQLNGADTTTIVTASVYGPSTSMAWTPVTLTEITTPEGHDRLFTGEFIPTAPGWHVVSYDTDPDGNEAMAKFYAYNNRGAIVGTSSSG